MSVRFLDLRKQYESIRLEIDAAIAAVIDESAFISGKYAARFEQAFAKFQDADHCVGCGNGTDAIEIALEALQLPKHSEVIVPANTFIATSEAVSRAGHKIVFCDCDPDDYTISCESLVQKITSKTAAVIVVHLYGQPCDMDRIIRIGSEYGLKVIEDCAQAHGAEYNGRRVGTMGVAGTFSFYPGKNLGAYGDAGAIVTMDVDLANRMRMASNHGRIAKFDHKIEGRNSRMDGIQAGVLLAKLPHLEAWLEQRRAIAVQYYSKLFGVGDIVLPAHRAWSRHVFHLFVVRTKRRDDLRKYLGDRNIETGVHYPIALPKLQAYEYCGQAKEVMWANSMDSELLSLPIGDHMDIGDVAEVADACRAFFASR